MTLSLRYLIAPLLVSVCLVSCTSSEEEAVHEAEADVLALHDEVMPRMGEARALRRRLDKRIAALDSVTGTTVEQMRVGEAQAQAKLLRRRLSESDSLMISWMDNYRSDSIRLLKPSDALRYLTGEKQKLSDVKARLTNSIEKTRQFLDD